MFDFLGKMWGLSKAYRLRLFIGVVAGVISGLMMPLLIAAIVFVYDTVFQPGQIASGQSSVSRMPEFVQQWSNDIRKALQTGVQAHPWTLAILVASIPLIMFLRGLSGFLNVYCLQWVASRAVADLRVRLFRHLLDLSAGFYNQTSSGQLISRVVNDTSMLQVILGGATSV